MAKEKDKKKKQKRPTAEKRMVQNKKKRLQNKMAKSEVRTSIRRFQESLNTKDAAAIQAQLKDVYSKLDKGVKKGLYKLNNASRKKSRLSAMAAKATA